MTRIIAGAVGSLRLKGPAKATRPTSDRVKESVFSVLESLDAIQGAEVLDLYAGTGALGLEAASRGASRVTLVEKDKAAAEVCRANLEAVKHGLEIRGLIVNLALKIEDVGKFLRTENRGQLVFLDPPYKLSNEILRVQIDSLLDENEKIVIVLERSSKMEKLEFTRDLSYLDLRRFGDTEVSFLSRQNSSEKLPN